MVKCREKVKIMSKETEAIFSSTGFLGVSRRPDASGRRMRLYVNGRFSDDPEEVQRSLERLFAIGDRHSQIGRSVFRGIVSQGVVEHILSNGLHNRVEVALPLTGFTDDSSWLIYMAQNRPGRDQIVPTDVMIRETENQREVITPLVERVRKVLGRGYAFIDFIPENRVDQVHALWGETFGWERHEVDNLRRRLDANRYQEPFCRDVWFSAIRDNGNIISVAMAERLQIPASNGGLDLVESTEWRTRDNYAGNGLMTATLVALNAQILTDLQSNPNGLPLIYAECNFQSRSDRAGHGAGFHIPDRTNEGYPAPQILVQNVLVRDGQPVEEGKLRDFTFMYLPVEVIQTQYNPMQTKAIMQAVRNI